MLDQLVESRTGRQGAELRKRLLIGCGLTIVAGAAVVLLGSLFSQTLAMGFDGIDAARLVLPMQVEQSEGPEAQDRSEDSSVTETQLPKATSERLASVDDVTLAVPEKVSSVPSNLVPGLGPVDPNAAPTGATGLARSSGGSPGSNDFAFGVPEENTKNSEKIEDPPKPPLPKPPLVKRPQFIGVVNGLARDLKTPPYPAAAKQMNIKGLVKVQVQIDEHGTVTNATVLEGHPLLRSVCVNAAGASRFSPTLLNNVPVPVRGIIVYNFK